MSFILPGSHLTRSLNRKRFNLQFTTFLSFMARQLTHSRILQYVPMTYFLRRNLTFEFVRNDAGTTGTQHVIPIFRIIMFPTKLHKLFINFVNGIKNGAAVLDVELI